MRFGSLCALLLVQSITNAQMMVNHLEAIVAPSAVHKLRGLAAPSPPPPLPPRPGYVRAEVAAHEVRKDDTPGREVGLRCGGKSHLPAEFGQENIAAGAEVTLSRRLTVVKRRILNEVLVFDVRYDRHACGTCFGSV